MEKFCATETTASLFGDVANPFCCSGEKLVATIDWRFLLVVGHHHAIIITIQGGKGSQGCLLQASCANHKAMVVRKDLLVVVLPPCLLALPQKSKTSFRPLRHHLRTMYPRPTRYYIYEDAWPGLLSFLRPYNLIPGWLSIYYAVEHPSLSCWMSCCHCTRSGPKWLPKNYSWCTIARPRLFGVYKLYWLFCIDGHQNDAWIGPFDSKFAWPSSFFMVPFNSFQPGTFMTTTWQDKICEAPCLIHLPICTCRTNCGCEYWNSPLGRTGPLLDLTFTTEWTVMQRSNKPTVPSCRKQCDYTIMLGVLECGMRKRSAVC